LEKGPFKGRSHLHFHGKLKPEARKEKNVEQGNPGKAQKGNGQSDFQGSQSAHVRRERGREKKNKRPLGISGRLKPICKKEDILGISERKIKEEHPDAKMKKW